MYDFCLLKRDRESRQVGVSNGRNFAFLRFVAFARIAKRKKFCYRLIDATVDGRIFGAIGLTQRKTQMIRDVSFKLRISFNLSCYLLFICVVGLLAIY